MKYILITILMCVSSVVYSQDYHGNHPADAIRAMRAGEAAKKAKAEKVEVAPIPDPLPNLDIQKLLDNISEMEKQLAELKKRLLVLKEYLNKQPNWAPPHPK